MAAIVGTRYLTFDDYESGLCVILSRVIGNLFCG